MKQGPFVKFEEIAATHSKRVTKRWNLRPVAGGDSLGHVSWFTHWRRYCFYPDSDKVFDANCLWDIADFCAKQTRYQQEAQRDRRRKA